MSDAPTEPEAAPAIPLTEPAGGVPQVITTPEGLRRMADAFAAGTGPIAADAERASGFRYGQATYLAQFKRAGAGIALVDTAALPDLSSLNQAFGDAEWVFHAASQDLPGMHDLGLTPASVFDTELAARLLGWPKVGLAAVVEREPGACARQGALGPGLVHPSPAPRLAGLCGPRRRGVARACVRRCSVTSRPRESSTGRERSSRRCGSLPRPRRGSSRGDGRPGRTRSAISAGSASFGHSGRSATK
ncbi:hypothetical protein [Demequina litorisediminis]|uniref:3'-5' exonuclease domain-containing protein n=1 Tax=Demequina litorisediminis TaxID=1849022 RepID=A0ABQ6IA75_9MICO|nr:hypothetical protein GCM10025876_01110 [Demequina litorisediminis]